MSVMSCDCIKTINEKLAERNMALDTTLLLSNLGGVTLSISTHWKDPAKKRRGERPTTLIVNFCPFCGAAADSGVSEAVSEAENVLNSP